MAARWAYVDTSLLVKRYIQEPGSAQARTLFRRYRLLTSAVASVELLSALSRRRIAGDIGEAQFRAIRSRLRHDRAYWELIEVNEAVLDQAENLITTVSLRALDAIHVASAMIFRETSRMRVPFLTADGAQAHAAEAVGIDTVRVPS